MQKEVTLSTEGYEILSSGSIIVPSNEYVQFEINGLRFRFSFVQESDEDNAEVKISKNVETDQSGKKCLTVLISNVRNSFFGSIRQSMQVATIDGRSLSVRFSLLSINIDEESKTEDRLLFYTWYLSKKINQEE